MLPTEQHVKSTYKAKAGWLVARAFPTVMRSGLQLVADWTVLFCVLDDYIEKRETAAEVEEYLQHLVTVFRADIAGSSEDPFAAGLMDIRARLLAMGSPSHFMSFADRLEELFAANIAEAQERERGQVPDIASYQRLREATIGLQPMFALGDILEGFNLPDCVRAHPALQQLSTRACNIVGWANDLFTYEKEIIQGEIHNLVLSIMTERQLSIAEAVAQAVALHDSEVRSFLREVEQLPSFGAADADVERYVEMLRCWIRGHLDWAHETGRYRPFEASAGELTGRSDRSAAERIDRSAAA